MESRAHCQAAQRRALFCALSSLLAISPLAVSPVVAADAAATPPSLPTANATLLRSDGSSASAPKALALAEKIIEKLGGLEKIKKFNSTPYRAKGNVEQISSLSGSSNTLPCEIVSQGRKQWISVTFMGQPVVTGYDGKECWTMQGNNAMPTDLITAKRVKEDLDHGLLLIERLLDKGRKLSLAEPRVINDVKCEALSVVADDDKPTIFYVDPGTNLVVRSEYQGADIEQGVDCLKAYEYLDYRAVDDTLQPFKAIEYSDKKKVSVLEITKLETNIKVADNFFKMPTESKIARLRSGPVRVPFQYTSNEILVMASVNGLPNRPFILDTGATQSIVDTATFRDMIAKPSEEVAITTGSGAMKMGFANLKTFQIGDIVLDNVPVAIADLSKFSQFLATRPHGLIGANILKRFLITIDYDKQELLLQDPDRVKIPEGAVAVETKPSLGVSGLAVEGVIDNNLKLSFLVDSGAAFNHVSESLIKAVAAEPLLPVGIIKGLDGTPVKTGAIRFKSLDIGKLSIKDPIFSVAPSNENEETPRGIISGGALAIIGNPLLSQYRVTIDYRNQKIYFEDTTKKAEAELDARLKRILADYYNHGNAKAATNQLAHLATDAVSQGCTATASLAMANEALYLSKTGIAAQKTEMAKVNKIINDKFMTAFDYAKRSDRKPVMAKVLSLWAQYYLQTGNANHSKARPLINKALATCQTEPSVYAAAGLLLASSEDAAGERTSTDSPMESSSQNTTKADSPADMMLNQSLMLDPSNWLALWTKYKLAAKSGNAAEKLAIGKHLKRYYPESEQVKRLEN
ncbi:aspartyl protease family protein [Candidatus Obscuribacterales bacterium]|nr:aspartyl protease family protein [Candidatus Obscuribacterales bacterium]